MKALGYLRTYTRRKLSSLILWALGLDPTPSTFNDDRWCILRLISQERSKSIHPKGETAIGFSREANGELNSLTWADGSKWSSKKGWYQNAKTN